MSNQFIMYRLLDEWDSERGFFLTELHSSDMNINTKNK